MRLLRSAAAALASVLTVACAKPPASGAAELAARTEPPQLLTRGSFPEFSDIEPNPAGRPSLRIQVEVLVDSLGRADIKTLKLTGLTTAQSRTAIERWLEAVLFRPAMRDGQPVSGIFKGTFVARVQRRM